MSSDVVTITEALSPMFVTRNPFYEARRLGLVLVPIVGAQGRYGRYPLAQLSRGWVEYDPTLTRAAQAYAVARAVLVCVLGEAGMLRELGPHVPIRALAEALLSDCVCDGPQPAAE